MNTVNEKIELLDPIPDAWTADPDKDPCLIGTRCQRCRHFHFPPAKRCTQCLSIELDDVPFGRSGILYAYSVIRISSPDFKAPYVIGYIDLDEGVRLLAPIVEWQDAELNSGKKMELVVGKVKQDANGNDVVGYMYRPQKKREKKLGLRPDTVCQRYGPGRFVF